MSDEYKNCYICSRDTFMEFASLLGEMDQNNMTIQQCIDYMRSNGRML